MSERKWTRPQSQAIRTRGGDLLVSAAAGSGKTAVLTERVLNLITDWEAPVDIDRLLIVTFSNAAAEEMRQRIAQRLYEKMEQEPENRALRRQSLLLGNAEICTIHAFCYRLIRENFQELGLPGDMKLGREGENELIQSAVLEALLDEEYEKGDPDFMRLMELFSGSRSDYGVTQALLQLYDFLRNHPFYRSWAQEHIKADAETPLEETAWCDMLRLSASETLQHAVNLIGECRTLLAGSEDELLRDIIGTLLRDDLAMLQRLMQSVSEDDWDTQTERILQASFPDFPRKKWIDLAAKEKIRQLRRSAVVMVRELKTDIYLMDAAQYRADQTALSPLMERLRELMLEFDTRYIAAKRERRRLDYSDLEHYTLALLVQPDGTPTALAKTLGSRYTEIMLDEYQDTSFLQEQVFRALTAGGASRFMVGDVKQSIYSFREACPENFLEKRADYFPVDDKVFPAKIALNANFRTRREITGFINRLFRQIMTQAAAGMEYLPEDELVASLPYDYGVPRPVTAMVITGDSSTRADDYRRAEAAEVAREIVRLLREGFTVEENGARRPVRPGDICILMRNAKNRDQIYIDALLERGVGARSTKNENLLETREVKIVLSYLAVLANPMLDIELAEVLTSPMYGFTSDDLAVLRQAGRRERLYRNLLEKTPENAKFGDFLRDYALLRGRLQELPAADMIREICEVTGFADKCRVLPEGEAAVANLRLLQMHAAEHEAEGRGESDFAEYLRRMADRGLHLQSAAPAQGDAVSVLTIHHSKGLEFPVVFLVGCGERFSRGRESTDIAMDRELGFACKLRDNYTMRQHKTLPLTAVQIKNQKLRLQEEMRVLYVALTRAREKLYLVASGSKAAQGMEKSDASETEHYGWSACAATSSWDWLRGAVCCEEELDLRLLTPWEQQEDAIAMQHDETKKALPAPEQEKLEKLTAALAYEYPYLADTVTPRRVAVSELAERAARGRYLLRRRPKCLTRQEATATERGNAAHRAMQFVDLAALRDDPKGELARLVTEGYLYREDGDLVEPDTLKKLIDSPLGERMLRADRIYREMRFLQEFTPEELAAIDETLTVPAATLVMGAVDAVLIEGDHAVLLDYKTDRIKEPEELPERYALQLRLYAAMVRRQLGLPVAEAILYSFHLGKAVKVEL